MTSRLSGHTFCWHFCTGNNIKFRKFVCFFLSKDMMSLVKVKPNHPTVSIGAGPYGLSIAAYLQRQGIPTLVFGKPQVQQYNGYPLQNKWFETSVPNLYFVGALAGHAFGPICRFVAGAKVPAQQITRHLAEAV
jgi:thioredoxin reductase